MTTLGRTVVTVLVVVMVAASAVVAGHYLWPSAPGAPEPTVVETPTGAPPTGAPPTALPPAAPVSSVAAAPPPSVAPAPVVVEASEPEPAPPPTVVVEPPAAPAQALSGPGASAAEQGLEMVRAGRVVEAQKRLSEALRAGIAGPGARAVHAAINQCADRLQLGPTVVPGDAYSKTYAVASGDTLTAIGQRFAVPYELIMRLNRLGSTSIYADQPLKVVQGPIHVEVLKNAHELRAWLGDVCLRVYPVGIGSGSATPEGTFLVQKKITNPPYQPQHKAASEHRPSGHPENPLGTRWIDIGNHFGIHGTIDPASIGASVSEGCIRMHNADVEELYDLVVPGVSKVIIRP